MVHCHITPPQSHWTDSQIVSNINVDIGDDVRIFPFILVPTVKQYFHTTDSKSPAQDTKNESLFAFRLLTLHFNLPRQKPVWSVSFLRSLLSPAASAASDASEAARIN